MYTRIATQIDTYLIPSECSRERNPFLWGGAILTRGSCKASSSTALGMNKRSQNLNLSLEFLSVGMLLDPIPFLQQERIADLTTIFH